MKVVWGGPIDNTGYGVANRRIVKTLAKFTDLDLIAKDLTTTGGRGAVIPPEERTLFEKLSSSCSISDATFVSLMVPEWFSTDIGVKSIGYTMFETDGLPKFRVAACNKADKIWVPTSFNKVTFANSGVTRPMSVVPLVVTEPLAVAPQRPEGATGFMFLYIGDTNIRKGWDILVRAYTRAFTENDDVTLVLKFFNGDASVTPTTIVDFIRAEREAVKNSPKIVVMLKTVSDNEIWSLIHSCDCFVLSSRGEGWGLPLSDAMAAGKPTIGPRWSGNLEFMNDENSYLIDIDNLVEVPWKGLLTRGYGEGQKICAPSVASLMKIMRDVVSNQEEARAKGERAKEILSKFGEEAVARIVVKELGNG